MGEIAENLTLIKSNIPSSVTLVAVSKTKPNALLQEAYDVGQRIFGENRVQELTEKFDSLPRDIEWHMIGHLQSNKVKYIAPFVSLIHAIDKPKLLIEVNKQAKRNNRIVRVLIQFHIAEETSKFGFDLEEAKQFLASNQFKELSNIEVAGVMGMATLTENENQVRNEFKTLKNIFAQLQQTFFSRDANFKEISMGMSGDYKIAIEEGSTMVRVGSSIFGKRG